ncbi:MAG TPA: sulfide/dihydroorotate dehydrogenase-like FAD/NAD-binding protein [Armatimonadetes bacterium]|nr:sulfide/dihydroorotate dehydrogenase-like FAD/NAD-binding protein [Armatimonadota bacterium]
MNEIVRKEQIAPQTWQLLVHAPEIARRRKAGQFVVLRVHEKGERFPLTLVSSDPEAGAIELIFQAVGTSTRLLAAMQPGQQILDLAGPLGRPTHIEQFGRCVVIGGGYGMAPVIPIAQALRDAGNELVGINGARSADNVILEDRLRAICREVTVCTDDGTYGRKGFVTTVLQEMIEAGERIDLVLAIGPTPMMRAVANLTRPHGISTVVSLNPIMVDGTGMCGGCRVEVGGETKFACIDGPEFDAHQVDFDLLMRRQRMYDGLESDATRMYEAHSTPLSEHPDGGCRCDEEAARDKPE